MRVDYKWKPFEDLPEDWATLRDGQLTSLLKVWQEQRNELESEGLTGKFSERLHREWAIETGVIEGVYSLDRGTTEVLLEHGIDARYIPTSATDKDPEFVAQVIQDHEAVLDGLFDFVKGNRVLTVGYIKELHAALLRRQRVTTMKDQFGELIEVSVEPGAYKKLPNNPRRTDGTIYEYCPPEHVASEMDRLMELHDAHAGLNVPPEIESAWLHHRFAQIHAFTDGNGRVARAIASIVLIKAGGFPLVIRREDRARYIDALELADSGTLAPFVGLVAQGQREALIEVLSF